MAFEKGHKLAPGGAREGSGRPLGWLKDKCQDLIEKKQIIEFLADVASGEYTEFVVVNGEKTTAQRSADADVRIKAAKELLDRGFGKAPQALEVSGNVNMNLIEAVKQARAQRGKA